VSEGTLGHFHQCLTLGLDSLDRTRHFARGWRFCQQGFIKNQCRIQYIINIDEDAVLEGNEAKVEEATKDDGDALNDDVMKLEYKEPLCQDMSEMHQHALQEMTAEKWKALVGDDYADFLEDTEDRGLDADTRNGTENNNKSGDGSDIELGKESMNDEMENFERSLVVRR